MNRIKRFLAIGALGISFAIGIGGIIPTTQVLAIDGEEAQQIVLNKYPNVMIYSLEATEDGYQVFFHSMEIASSSVTIDNDGNIVAEDVTYR